MPVRRIKGSPAFVFHVLNRGVRRATLFDQAGDYRAFLRVMREAHDRIPIRVLAYCLMPNHFHLVLWPRTGPDLTQFMWWLTGTHSKRWHVWRGTGGTGPVYQGRFKAIPVQSDHHFLTVCRYVERNALRADLVDRAEHWPWSSLYQRCKNRQTIQLDTWPIPPPSDWAALVNLPQTLAEIEKLRTAVRTGVPFGTDGWSQETATELGLRPVRSGPGRPKKTTPGVILEK